MRKNKDLVHKTPEIQRAC